MPERHRVEKTESSRGMRKSFKVSDRAPYKHRNRLGTSFAIEVARGDVRMDDIASPLFTDGTGGNHKGRRSDEVIWKKQIREHL